MGAAATVTGVGANVPKKTKLKFVLTRVKFRKLCNKAKLQRSDCVLLPQTPE